MLKNILKLWLTICFWIVSCQVLAFNVVNGYAISLNGDWEIGFGRNYKAKVEVPGIAIDPAKMELQKLWYKRQVQLPPGNWQFATLELKGARFMPEVYINGQLVSKQNGGMAPTFFSLEHPDMKPGNSFTLEIALQPLKNVPVTDASYIPLVDQWRSNVSSCLWDDVVLHLHGTARINNIVPFIDFKQQQASVRFKLDQSAFFSGNATLQVINQYGRALICQKSVVHSTQNTITFKYAGVLKEWSPQSPNLYQLKLTVTDANGKQSDESIIPFGIKEYRVEQKHFYLNGESFTAKGGTVVWHRWVRSKEGRELGFDTAWFKKNIVMRLKEHGANYLRFHLGKPPERLLDLCDRYGLVVQYEWSFFHGMPATKESLLEQYKNWMDVAVRHPCVSMLHPTNETEGEQLKTVESVLAELLPNYPNYVLEDRDVIHIHKYWWSIFENVGLYYDNASQFPKAIMVDEFGGNYLDENGDLGGYKSLRESFLRFLGRNHTKEERLAFQAQSCSQIAEYWRRIGAAGFAPFCILSSYEDGNNWFLGAQKQAMPKPVWDAMTAAYSPLSVSLELWDKDFTPFQQIKLPTYLFNDQDKAAILNIKISVESKVGKTLFSQTRAISVSAFSKSVQNIALTMPGAPGEYTVKAELLNKPASVKYRVISQWNFRVLQAKVPDLITGLKIGVPADEPEIRTFLTAENITIVDVEDASAQVILTSLASWNKIVNGNHALLPIIQSAVENGRSVVMLDVGDRPLGQGYPSKPGDLGNLQGINKVTNPVINSYSLFGGLVLKFTETAEPESYIHPDIINRELWAGLPDEYTRIWNGYRGGLNVPARDMQILGMSAKAFNTQWKSRGADENKIISGPYYAYELQGFYEFSDKANDINLQKKLKSKVQFLVQDAPALANSINPLTPVVVTDLTNGYHHAENGIADNYIPLANCAKNLTQTPVALIEFGKRKGNLLVSQLLTSGRLAQGYGQPGLYGIRYDEAAVQFVLNMINVAVSHQKLN